MLGIGALKDAALKPSFNFEHKTQYKILKAAKKISFIKHHQHVY